MGGLAKSMPYTRCDLPDRLARARRDPDLLGLLVEGRDHQLGARVRRALGWTLYIGGLLGAILTGLYTFRLYFRVFHGEPSARRHGAHARRTHHGEGARSMLIPVGVLALGSTFIGFLAIPGVWEPFETWLEPVVPPLVQATAGEDWLTSLFAVDAAARSGIFLAWRAFQAGRELVADGALRTALEHKLWFDELYDVVFSRPAQLIAVRLRDRFEAPVVQGGLDEVADGTLRGASVTASAQTGLLRTYALAITVAVSVLTLVFLVVR